MSKNNKSAKSKIVANNKSNSFDFASKKWFFLIAIIVLTIIVYSPISDAGFVNWDDSDYVHNNVSIQSFDFGMIKDVFLSGIHPDYPSGLASNYHPLTMLSLAANYAMSGLNASSYHWTNLLIHLLNTFLVFVFLGLIFKKGQELLVLLGVLIFAIHPMHVESVAWISERKDVLFVFFYLLGLIYYLKGKQREKSYGILVFFFFLCSLLSKPTAVTFPIILVLMDWLYDQRFDIKKLLFKIPYFILSILFGLITLKIQTEAIGDVERYNILQKLGFGSFGLMHYIWNFIAPLNLATFYPYPEASNIPFYIQFAPLGLLLVAILVYYVNRKSKLVIFGFSMFVVAHLLTLQFFQVGASLVSDRYTYLSFVGLSIVLIHVLSKFFYAKDAKYKTYSMLVTGIIGIWLLALSVKTYQQTKTWKNGKVLWENVVEKFPKSSFGLTALGHYYMEEKDYKTAIKYLDKAKANGGKSYDFLNKRGNTLRVVKRLDEALIDLNQAIKIEPEKATAYKYRANVYLDQNKLNLALADYQKCLEIEPQNYDVQGNLGAYYFKTKEYDKAIEQYDKFIELSPEKTSGYLNKAAVYLLSGKYSECLESLKLFKSSGGKIDGQFHYYKTICFEKTNRINEALVEINKAISFNKQDKNYIATKARLEKAKTN